MPASALLFRRTSCSFRLVHRWHINKPFENQKSYKIQKTDQGIPQATGEGRVNILKMSDQLLIFTETVVV